ncbi:hypothetical protein OAB57_02800 [Bacteriovoracaceae bacterium]|nr:hypothetical protein [Bacteriovoracaceae bacterium]
MMISGTVIFIFGLLDDIYQLRPHSKILGQLISATILIYFGFGFPFENSLFSSFATIFWIITITNAFNLLDNMDGLSSGIALVSLLLISTNALVDNNLILFIFCGIFGFSILGFWILNKCPAKIFMGDCGSQYLGLMLASLVLLNKSGGQSNLLSSLIFPISFLSIPIFDTLYVSITRFLDGRKISQGGKDHLSHRLVKLGLSEKKAVNFLIKTSLLIGTTISYSLYYLNKLPTIFLVIIFAISLASIGMLLTQIFNNENVNVNEQNIFKVKMFISHKKRFLETIIDVIIIFASAVLVESLLFIKDFDHSNIYLGQNIGIFLICKLSFLYLFKCYRGEWRFISIPDIINIFKASVSSYFCLLIIDLLFLTNTLMNHSFLVFDTIVTFNLLVGVRSIIRITAEYIFKHSQLAKPVILCGHDKKRIDVMIKRLKGDLSNTFNPVGIYFDGSLEGNVSVQGVKLLTNIDEIFGQVQKHQVKHILFDEKNFDHKLKETFGHLNVSTSEINFGDIS